MFDFTISKRNIVRFRGQNKVIGGLTDKEKIAILLHISKQFGTVDKEEELLNSVIQICKEIFEATNVTLRFFDGEYLVPVKFSNQTNPPRRNLLPSEGFSGLAFTEKKSIIFYDLENMRQYLDEGETTRCVICIPLKQKDEVLGTLSVESDKENFYIPDDLEILEAVGAQFSLALSSVRLIEGLITARAREKAILAQLEWDMKMGRNVQTQILPQSIKPWNGVYFSSYYEPMVEVSGDLYDVIRQGNSLTAINVDVSGHGIPAALVTMTIHNHFRRLVYSGLGLTEIMEELGESLRGQLPESTYFTAFLVRIFADYTYAYVNAGHQKMLHIHSKTNTIEELDTMGVPLGILEVRKKDYQEKQGKLEPGDILVLMTDGFPEQKNPENQEAGTELVKEWLIQEKIRLNETNNGKLFIRDLKDAFIERFRQFKSTQKNGDDLSLLMIQCNDTVKEAYPYIQKAKQANANKKFEDAYALAYKAYKIDPSLKENLLFLGKLNFRDGRYEEAIQYFSEYISTSGDDTAIAHYLLGRAYYQAGRIAEAKRSLKKSISSDHTFIKSNLLLAKCYLKENERAKAVKVLQQGMKSVPNNEVLKASLIRLEGLEKKTA